MSDPSEYIEDFFTGRLSEEEKKLFGERCVRDPDFARQVALYIASREAVRQTLLEQKRQQWVEHEALPEVGRRALVKKMPVRKWLPYAAAACVLTFAVLFFFSRSTSPQQMAVAYIDTNLGHISQTMAPSNDSLQLGIAAYNAGDYSTALKFFTNIPPSHPQQTVVKKYTGLAYLLAKDHDKALECFEELAAKEDLYQNPGLFLKAVALLQRDRPGDKEQAKQLLEQVVQAGAEGSNEARKWLAHWR